MRAATAGVADLDRPPSPEEELARKDTRACIRGEIGKLPEAHRAVLMLSMLGGLGDEEIAQGEAAPRQAGVPQDHRGALRLLPQRIVLQAHLARLLRLRDPRRQGLSPFADLPMRSCNFAALHSV